MPLSVEDTSVELFGPDVRPPYVWDGAASLWDGAAVRWDGDVWNAVDCQVTEAAIAWGADDPSGVLVQSAAGRLLMSTYDPLGLLDPANPASPYAAMLAPGTPLRVTYAGSPLRAGRLAEASYDRASQTGRLEGRDAIAELAAANTPATFRASSNALRTFAAEVIAAASLTVPVEAAPGSGDSVIAWRERTSSANVWALIRDAAFDALHLAYVDPTGLLRFAPFGAPVDRGLVIGDGGICLEALETARSDEGVYTDVADGAGQLVSSGLAQPRMLTVERREPAGAAWAAAIKNDRAAGAVQYAPSLIRPGSVAELEALAAVRGVDKVRLRLTTPPAIDVRGRVLGERLRAPAGGDWSAEISMYVPPVDWAYVPPTPAAVAGTPLTREVPADADADVALVWHVVEAVAKATGAGQSTGISVSGGPSTSVAAGSPYRSLFRFDLTDDAIWAGVRIYRSAQLRLWASIAGAGAANILARRILEPWQEGYATGTLAFNNGPLIWPGPATTTAGESLMIPPAAAGYWYIDVSAIVRAWIPRSLGGDGLPNFGLRLHSANEAVNQSCTFRSRENSLGTPPMLIIAGEG